MSARAGQQGVGGSTKNISKNVQFRQPQLTLAGLFLAAMFAGACGGESTGSGGTTGGGGSGASTASTSGTGATGASTSSSTTGGGGATTSVGGSTTSVGGGGSGAATSTGGTGAAGGTSSGGTGGTITTGGTAGTTGSGGSGGCLTNQQCDDGAFCNGPESCVNGACVAGTSPCDDDVSCTMDVCDETMDFCVHTAMDALCSNGLLCDGVETCSAVMGCLSGTPVNCDDNVQCTADFCDPGSGQCAHVPDDTFCSNGNFCDGTESCDPLLGDPQSGCLAGMPVNCSDGIACTADACSEAQKTCVHTAQNAACDDGMFCNGSETCVVGQGCQPGTQVVCNDGKSCTIDTCSNATAGCVFTVNNAACDDGLDCNGVETCSLSGPGSTGCVAGTPIPCAPDAIPCTIDACDENTNSCAHTPTNGACPQGQLCIPQAGGCTAAPPCQTATQCDDGNACNGVETCNGVCQPGTPVTCNDNIACTIDSCNPANGACVFAPNNAACDDGFACNGVESCSAQTGCVAGTAVNCNDNVACTEDYCFEPGGTCVHNPNNTLCSDGQLCNGLEQCTPNGCQPGPAFVCPSDGVACTQDTCDPVLNSCVYTANDAVCPCGQTCNAAQGGCGSFCTVSTCQGKVYACGDCLDNDGDCKVDSNDTQCLGPCDNTEDSFYGGIPGQNNSPCKSDCYFDQDTGSGNDDCYWSHKCDPLEVAPNYPPEGSQCAYNPNANIPGYNGNCQGAFTMQSVTCIGYCGPLTPNGCDCFGCCAIPGAPTTVWLGSENPSGVGSCNLNTLNDPTKCKPCTQVQACLNTCDYCEICIGKPTIPADCAAVECADGISACGLPGLPNCPVGFTCITGCCQANPN